MKRVEWPLVRKALHECSPFTILTKSGGSILSDADICVDHYDRSVGGFLYAITNQ